MHPSQFSTAIKIQGLEQDTDLRARLVIAPNRLFNLPQLTTALPPSACRISVIIPVRNEAENLPAVIEALAHQTDSGGNRLDASIYEVLVLANNCTDRTVQVVENLIYRYPFLQLRVVEVLLPKEAAFVGKARQMVMDEAYRRFSLIGLQGRIIASTDGDTRVAPDWIDSLLREFDKGIDAVGGRILTCRQDETEISPAVSLHYLRRVAHAYLSSQIACFIDPQVHDCWPRHFQFCGANMAVSARMYELVGGMPLVRDEEDIALYQQLQRADAKIRHSLNVQVKTSARQVGRATGGLSALLTALSTQARQDALVEAPLVTEARMVVRRCLRQVWAALQDREEEILQVFGVGDYGRTAELLARSLGLPGLELQSHIESAATFGELVAALSAQQLERLNPGLFESTTEISLANMHLRQRLSCVRRQVAELNGDLASSNLRIGTSSRVVLEALQQVQAIPLFPPAYQ